MELNIEECEDLLEAIACETDKHKKEGFHQNYLNRLEKLRLKIIEESNSQPDPT